MSNSGQVFTVAFPLGAADWAGDDVVGIDAGVLKPGSGHVQVNANDDAAHVWFLLPLLPLRFVHLLRPC